MKLQRLRRRANLNRGHSLKNPPTIHLSYLRVDECRWKKIGQVSSAATDHCTSTAVASKRLQSTDVDKKRFCFALFKFKYTIHLAFVTIGWYLARDMALGAHGWPRRYLPRLRARLTSSIFASPAAWQICRLGQRATVHASGHMALAKYVNNIHRARVNIGWYLASAIWPEVRTVDRVYIFAEPQARQISTRSTVRTEGHITS